MAAASAAPAVDAKMVAQNTELHDSMLRESIKHGYCDTDRVTTGPTIAQRLNTHYFPPPVGKYLLESPRVVSVGSGCGVLEYRLTELRRIAGLDAVVCVDPSPNSFNEGPIALAPSFPTVADYLKSTPSGHRVDMLMIIWPSPSGGREEVWDIEAIRLLRPRRLLLVYETLGASGSPGLRVWAGSIYAALGYKLVTEHVHRAKIELPSGVGELGAALSMMWDMMGIGTLVNRLAMFEKIE